MTTGPTHKRWPFRASTGVDVVEITPRVTVADGEAALRLALEGAGIIRLSDVIVGAPIRAGQLVPLLMDVHHVEPCRCRRYFAGRHRLPKCECFSIS
jgi:DNA-binding transcriptional LysR family regulator